MSIPSVSSFVACTDFSKTVVPYLPELAELPGRLVENIASPSGLYSVYASTNPLVTSVAFSLAIIPILFVAQEVNKNYSQVDRVWSLLPTFYNVHYALYAHANNIASQRQDLLALTSCIWSARLTFNYWRKGGYTVGSEDYRWEILMRFFTKAQWTVFSFVIVAFYQSLLLVSVSFPAYVMFLTSQVEKSASSSGLTTADFICAGLMLTFVTGSAVSDQQQWNYQNAKKDYRSSAKVPPGYQRSSLDRGFLTGGLFSLSRHPNFLCEQSVWWSVYVWSCASTNTYFNWAIIGPISYMILFQGSTPITETISSHKYPEYKDYQKKVGMFLPGLGYGNTMPASLEKMFWGKMDEMNKETKADGKKKE
ncbi:hypothetical protein MMC25_000895 [Agyrium rufum]|nr:hypothetical protein [Agyrium rufum]